MLSNTSERVGNDIVSTLNIVYYIIIGILLTVSLIGVYNYYSDEVEKELNSKIKTLNSLASYNTAKKVKYNLDDLKVEIDCTFDELLKLYSLNLYNLLIETYTNFKLLKTDIVISFDEERNKPIMTTKISVMKRVWFSKYILENSHVEVLFYPNPKAIIFKDGEQGDKQNQKEEELDDLDENEENIIEEMLVI